MAYFRSFQCVWAVPRWYCFNLRVFNYQGKKLLYVATRIPNLPYRHFHSTSPPFFDPSSLQIVQKSKRSLGSVILLSSPFILFTISCTILIKHLGIRKLAKKVWRQVTARKCWCHQQSTRLTWAWHIWWKKH